MVHTCKWLASATMFAFNSNLPAVHCMVQVLGFINEGPDISLLA